MGWNGRRRATDRDRDYRFSGHGMGFMPYLHAPHHEGIPTPSSTLGTAASTITEPPLPAASKHGDNGWRREGNVGIHLNRRWGGQ